MQYPRFSLVPAPACEPVTVGGGHAAHEPVAVVNMHMVNTEIKCTLLLRTFGNSHSYPIPWYHPPRWQTSRVLDQILIVIILRRWQDDEIRGLHYPVTAHCEEKEQFLIIFSQYQTAWLLALSARMSPKCMDTLLLLGVLVQRPEALQLQTGFTEKEFRAELAWHL